MFYVYFIIDPRTGVVFYVGKGRKYRSTATVNLSNCKNPIKKAILQKIKQDGLTPKVEIIAMFWEEQDALDFEKECVSSIGRIIDCTGPLSNLTTGGDTSNTGWIPNTTTRERWSKQRKGKVQSPEHVASRVSKTKGKQRSLDQKKNYALAKIRRDNPEQKALALLEILSKTPWHGMNKYLSEKYQVSIETVSRIRKDPDIYKEALHEWISEQK